MVTLARTAKNLARAEMVLNVTISLVNVHVHQGGLEETANNVSFN